MTQANRRKMKIFTVEEANAFLPLVRAITGDIVHLSRELRDRRQRLELLSHRREPAPGDPYGEELAQIRQELAKEERRLGEFERELTDLGVTLQSATDGLVDFPAVFEGRSVFLCWKYDEPEVLYWHERDAGFAGRQPLTADSVSDAGDNGGRDAFDVS